MRTAKTDQSGQMPRLIWVFAGRTLILLVLSCQIKWTTSWKKHVFRSVWSGNTQIGLLSYRSWPEAWNFACNKNRYYTIKAANKGTAQSDLHLCWLRMALDTFSHDLAQICDVIKNFWCLNGDIGCHLRSCRLSSANISNLVWLILMQLSKSIE